MIVETKEKDNLTFHSNSSDCVLLITVLQIAHRTATINGHKSGALMCCVVNGFQILQ